MVEWEELEFTFAWEELEFTFGISGVINPV